MKFWDFHLDDLWISKRLNVSFQSTQGPSGVPAPKKEVANPGTNLRTCVKLAIRRFMHPLKTFTIKVRRVHMATDEAWKNDGFLICLRYFASVKKVTQYLCVHLESIILLINPNFVSFKINLFKICFNSTIYSYFGGAAADFPALLLFEFETWERQVLSRWGKAALAVQEATRGGEARQWTTVLIERIDNGGNSANRGKDETGSSFRTCLKSSQSSTGWK